MVLFLPGGLGCGVSVRWGNNDRVRKSFGRAEGYVTWMLILKDVKALIANGAEETLH